MTDPQQLLTDIREARQALEKGANQIYKLTLEFEGADDESTGKWLPGPKWRYQDKVFEASQQIREGFRERGERVPAAAHVELMAEQRVKENVPLLWADYHRLASQIEATKRWLGAKKEAVSALQSELSTERALAR